MAQPCSCLKGFKLCAHAVLYQRERRWLNEACFSVRLVRQVELPQGYADQWMDHMQLRPLEEK